MFILGRTSINSANLLPVKSLFFILNSLIILPSVHAQIAVPISSIQSELFQTEQVKSIELSGQLASQKPALLWCAPLETPGTVGQFEKVEIGVRLDSVISTQLLNQVFRQEGDKINPFNPDEIDVYAEFWVQSGAVWYGPIRVNAFYYQDYTRTAKGWALNTADDLFRIRFAPEFLGHWRCKVSAQLKNESPFSFEEFTFETIPSDNKGFVRVGDHKRFLREGEAPFFPVGQNLTGPNNPSHTLEWNNKTAAPSDYIDFQVSMSELASAGGNYFRYIVSPWQTEIEFEELGNYSDRMPNAWEFDQILDHANVLDLKLHLNLAMHYSFEAPNGYAMTSWDWSAKGDDLNPSNSPCFKEDDKGYCYRNELGLVNPQDFLTDSLAIVYYKRRLRYMVARWGYSTNIAVMELLSEANNFGNESIIENKTINGKYGCYSLPDTAHIADSPYKDFPQEIIPKLMSWQLEMCRYLKEDLGITQHPIAVSYTGEPDFVNGDSTYYSSYVDIATFNNYGLSINKFEKNYLIVSKKYHTIESPYYLDKPFMHSEYGPGGAITNCDEGIRFVKTVNLTPFTGLAGSGINWHFHWNEDSMWNYLRPVKELLDSIPLDAENWQAGEPIIMKDKSVEVMYLYRPKVDGKGKAVGVVSNRTFNFYTGGIDLDGGSCKDDSLRTELLENPLYLVPTDLLADDLRKKIKLNGMGSSNSYQIEWFNALTGKSLGEYSVGSTIWGKLELDYPGNLSGNAESPMLFFRIRPYGESVNDISEDTDNQILPENRLPLALALPKIRTTNWN